MAIEPDGHSRGNPRMAELFENAPRTGKSPTVFAFPQLVEYLKVAGQPVQGPWPPHQEPRPDPTDVEAGPDRGSRAPRPHRPRLAPDHGPSPRGLSMYPSRFPYEAPTLASTRRSACCTAGGGEAKVLAGGQSRCR